MISQKMESIILVCLFLIKIVHCSNIWQSYEFDSGIGNREEIFIEKIVAQENLTVNGNVQKWIRGINCPDYALGIGLKEIFILHLENRKNNETLEIDYNRFELKYDVQAVLLFSYYNYTSRINQIILVIAVGKENASEIRWHKLDGNFKVQKEAFWSWMVQNPVLHITYSDIEKKLIIIHKTDENLANIDVFQISLENRPKFSIIQTIPLETATDNTALNFDGNTVFLSLPQGNHVRILKYHEYSFIPYKNITCTFVEHVIGFHIGIKSYLAIDGLNAGIYRFTRRTLVKQDIEHGHLDGTNYWLSIPINSYCHKDILLVQKNISHDTFNSLMLEVVSKSGDKFSFHEETVCEYYGESFVGLNCITDENRSLGIQNAAILVNGDSNAAVLSHSDGSTTIFKIKIGQKDMPSPVIRQMEELKTKRKRIEEALEEIKISSAPLSQIQADSDELDILKQNPPINWNLKPEKLVEQLTIEDITSAIAAVDRRIQKNAVTLENRRLGRFDTIIINGLLEVHGESRIRNVETDSDLEKEINDIARIDHISRITGHKEFVNLETQNLTFETVNGIHASDLKHKGDVVEIIGDLIFEKPVIVHRNIITQDNLINGVDLKKDVVYVKEHIGDNIRFNNLKVADTFTTNTVNKFLIHNNYLNMRKESENKENPEDFIFDQLYLPGNLTIKYVNNKDLDDFLHSLCLINLKTYIPGTINITGKTTLSEKSTTKTLNALKFPEDYVLNDSEDFSKFTGKKHFKLVQAKEATTTYLNDLEPENIVTLSQDQNINGRLIFDKLEIAESISVGGKVTGSNRNVFISNPTMVETKNILANVNFKSLEIEGTVTILNNFNGSKFENKMKAVIYKDDETITLLHPKQFINGITVENDLVIKSNLVNRMKIDDLVSKHSNGEINLQRLSGKIEIQNLQVQGLVNNCNITKLERETVKLSGDQFLTSKFIFSEELLISNTLDIKESINELTEFDLLFNDGNRILEELDIENVFAERIIIEKNIQAELQDFNLEEFETTRLSYSMDQYISSTIETAHVEASVMNASIINDHAHYELFSGDNIRRKILDMFFSEKLTIQNLIVEETINLSSINEVNINELFSKCLWSGGVNVYTEPIVFLDNIHCNNIFIDNFNSVPFNDFVNNIIYKNETDVIFSGLKNYINGFHVKNYIDTKFINNIKVNNVLRKSGDQTIFAPIEIFGDVDIENSEISETLNGVPVNQLIDSFERISDNTVKINGDVMFSRFSKIDNLNVKGSVNGRNITEAFQTLINVHEDMHFAGTTIFEDFVYIKGNMDVLKSVNEVDMNIFNENVVCISNDAEFDDVVTFGEHVDILQKLYVEIDFVSRFVNGIDMQSWLENAVFINKGIIPGTVTFEHAVMNGNLLTKFINGLNMSSLIPLRTDQNLNVKLLIDNVNIFNEIVVENLVNGFKLENEVAKTVMMDKENIISSEIIFENNVVVREELNMASMVNDKDLSKIITTQTDQLIHGKLIFSEEVILERGLASAGFLNDINLTDWEGRGMRKSVPFVQNLRQPIFADKVIFDGNVIGIASVNKMNARTLADQVEGKKLMKKEIEEKLIDSYSDICTDVNLALKLARQQLLSLDYLEQVQMIDFERNIELLHKFEYQETHYLLVHEQNACTTNVFSWSKNKFYYSGQTETGIIHQIITIQDNKDLFFVTRSDYAESNCTIVGSNIWQFETEDITLKAILNIEDQVLLEESQILNTFYGISKDSVVEYQLNNVEGISLKKYRKWQIVADNLVFIPRGLNTGMALIDGVNIYRLMKNDAITESDVQLGFETTFVGKVLVENNTIFPGRYDGEMIVLRTGEFNKNLMVALTHRNGDKLHDNIKIYDDWKMLTLYQEIQTINPSSLMTINFENNGESFLYFLEDNRKLRMFEYKGILGFLERMSADIEGTHLVPLNLINENNQENHFIVVIDKNNIKMFKTIMRGSKISANTANCDL